MIPIMNNLTIKRTARIQVNFTADQWELYRDVEVAAFGKEGAETYRNCAAAALNLVLSSAVNGGGSREEVELQMSRVMNAYKHYGASDTEPRYLLGQALNEIFGEE